MGTKKTGRKNTRMNSVQEQAREQKAWELMRAGWSPKATAEYLNVSERQVRRYAEGHVRIAAEKLADEIAGDIQIIRAHALEAAAKDDLGNRAFWWQLYIGVVMAYARGLFTRQQTIIDQRLQQIVIPNVDEFYRDIRELRRQTPPLALPPGIEAGKEMDEGEQYLQQNCADNSYPPHTLLRPRPLPKGRTKENQ